jgi:carboxypeptidase Q
MRVPRLVSLPVAIGLLLAATGASSAQPPIAAWLRPYQAETSRLIRAATADDFAWRRLAEMTDAFGSRLSGSVGLARAVAWAAETMRRDGLENVRLEPVMVPQWVRVSESVELVEPAGERLAALALGGSVATPPGGVEADVLVVSSFDELRARGAEARGKVVLFDAPFTNYGDTVAYRTNGARVAALQGAVGVLVRSVGPVGLRTPHTGAVQYGSSATAIPAASLAAEDAGRLARLAARGGRVRVRLRIDARYEPDVESANVVGEIRGREKPGEIVLLGGHLDSWDVGTGASDDGVGCIITWEALRLMKALNLRPRRTVRVVLFTNEENGLRGASAYAARYAAEAANHVFALESDSGVFAPATLGFSGSTAARLQMRDIGALLAPIGLAEMSVGGGGADVGPIAQAGNAPMMAYLGDPTRYFTIHHSAADTVERIAPDEVSRAAAAIAVVSYVVAEMPDRLPR